MKRAAILLCACACAGSAPAVMVYSTSFEGTLAWQTGWSSDPSHPYELLPDNSYRPYYGDGNMGQIGGSYTNLQTGSLGDNWTVLPSGAHTGVDLVRNTWTGVPNTPAGQQWVDLIGTSGPGGLLRTFHVDAGTTYMLSWLDFSNLNDGGQTYNVLFGGTDTGITGFGGLNVSTTAGTAWTSRTLLFTATGTGDATLRFYSSNTSNGNTGVDSVSIEAVPEPLTMSLIGAGLGLALLRRKRGA